MNKFLYYALFLIFISAIYARKKKIKPFLSYKFIINFFNSKKHQFLFHIHNYFFFFKRIVVIIIIIVQHVQLLLVVDFAILLNCA
jgi:hypothetical protein